MRELAVLLVVGMACNRPAPDASPAAPTASVVASATASAAIQGPPPCIPKPLGPPHHDPPAADLAPTGDHVEATLKQLALAHPCRARLVKLGESHQKRAVWALAIGDDLDAPRPSVLLNGAHHGDEPLSVAFALDAARALLADGDPRTARLRRSLHHWVVPLVNPDGLVVHRREAKRLGRDPGTDNGRSPGRKNGRDNDGDGRFGPNDGVDLNRNYPFQWGYLGEAGSTSAYALRIYRGPDAGSEPETQAMMALARREVFAGAISFHIGAVAILVPYTIDRTRSPEPNVAWSVARAMSVAIVKHPSASGVRHYPVQRNLYAVDGTDQDWHLHAHGTQAYIVEGSLRATPTRRRADAVKAIRGSWMGLGERLLDGPAVMGRVVDAEGHPVAAQVHLAEVRHHEGESWRARCRDGHFTRFVDTPGNYHLEVKVDGYPVVKHPVSIEGLTDVAVRLPFVVPAAPCSE